MSTMEGLAIALRLEAERQGLLRNKEAERKYLGWAAEVEAALSAEPVAWVDPECPRHVISHADKRDLLTVNGPVGAMKAAPYSQPLFTRPKSHLTETVQGDALPDGGPFGRSSEHG